MSQPSHPILILIRGLPGSGKSYIAIKLNAALQSLYGPDSTVVLDPDATDYTSEAYLQHVKDQTAEGVDPILHPYRFLRAQAYSGITGNKIIVWNQPFTGLDSFLKVTDRLQEYAKEHDTTLPMLVVEVNLDPEVAKARVDARKQAGGHGPSDATFQRFANDYKSFAEHGFTTIAVQGDADTSQSVATILQAIQNL